MSTDKTYEVPVTLRATVRIQAKNPEEVDARLSMTRTHCVKQALEESEVGVYFGTIKEVEDGIQK